MKILYLITRAEMGGAQVHVADLVDAMKQRAEVVVATGEHGYLTDYCRKTDVPFHVLKHLQQPIGLWRDGRALVEIMGLIRDVRPALVHAHTSKAGLIGRLAAALTRTPCVFTAHTWSFAEGISWKQKAIAIPTEYVAGKLCERIITVSESNRGRALKWKIAAPGKLVTVWNGVPDTLLRAQPGRTGIPRIVMVARFAGQKDHMTLVRATAKIPDPYTLTFVGDGPTRSEVEREAGILGISSRVEFVGVRTDTDAILARSDIFALSTRWEGFPLTIIEAMRAGLPVIATDVDGVREAVLDGMTGFLTQKGDLEQLRARLLDLIRDPALRAGIGASGRTRYEANFTFDNMLKKTCEIYQGVVRNGVSRRATPWTRSEVQEP
jgi:glycosyltransferase involved in cell wall biosynthesis